MDAVVVRPGTSLSGAIKISGATKNSGLKQLAAALLAPGVTVVRNLPPVADLEVMIAVLRAVGAEVEWAGPEELHVDTTGRLTPEAPYDLVSRMRASINVLGPLLARCGEARVALPGGDNIGSRKLDMHFRGLTAMGAELEVSHGFVEARCNKLNGAVIVLDFPSVGATENLLTAAVLAKGETVIENAAREPEIRDLTAFLNRMGAHILGSGTSTIRIEGVRGARAVRDRDHGRPDRGWHVPDGVRDRRRRDRARRCAARAPRDGGDEARRDGHARRRRHPTGSGRLRRSGSTAVDIATLPYPGFATDFMPMAVALLAVSEGTAIVTENVFDNRFSFVDELVRMGADVRTEGRYAVVRGVERLSGAPVRALDVRAGAALALAGLAGRRQHRRARVAPRRAGVPRLRGRAHHARRRHPPHLTTRPPRGGSREDVR